MQKDCHDDQVFISSYEGLFSKNGSRQYCCETWRSTLNAIDSMVVQNTLQSIKTQARQILGDGTFSLHRFETHLIDFLKNLPCKPDDFQASDGSYRASSSSFYGNVAGSLFITWHSHEFNSTLSVGAFKNMALRNPCWNAWFSCANHELLYTVASQLLLLVAIMAGKHVQVLQIEGFDNTNHQSRQDSGTSNVRPPTIEDVFQAFGSAGYWKTTVEEIVVRCSHMCARGEDDEELMLKSYPESLKRMTVDAPVNVGGKESSTVYKIASHSRRLKTLETAGLGYSDGTLTLANPAIQLILNILSTANTLDASSSCLLDGLVVDVAKRHKVGFGKVLKALATDHSRPPPAFCSVGHDDDEFAKYKLVKFYLTVNKYRDILFSKSSVPRSLAPLILEHCQQNQPYYSSKCDLLFYLIRECPDW